MDFNKKQSLNIRDCATKYVLLVPWILLAGCLAQTDTRTGEIYPANFAIPEAAQSANELQPVEPTPDSITPLRRPIDLSDQYMQSIFEEARQHVESYFDISLAGVSMHIVDNDVIEYEVRQETRALISPQFSDATYAERFLAKIMKDQSGTYAALYANRGKRILVNRPLLSTFLRSLGDQQHSDDPNLVQEALTALLIHEAVHAADDQLHQIHERREMNFRASFSQSAAYEGHAQLVTREICQKINCGAGLLQLDDFMFNAPEPTDPLARSMQAISRNVLEYSYIEGERFLAKIKERADGAELLTSVLRSPPTDPVQILDPLNYPDHSRIDRNRTIYNTLTAAAHPWNTQPWAMIETSPIKGLDLRNDPLRREATIEGFTKLIVSMVGAQAYDQSGESMTPIEITIMQTDQENTAELFARSFHEKAMNDRDPNVAGNRLNLTINQATDTPLPMVVYLSNTNVEQVATGNYATLIAHSGPWIIQTAGSIDPGSPVMIDFAEKVIGELRAGDIGKEIDRQSF